MIPFALAKSGYKFCALGSVEGFKPAEFVSSRQKRAGVQQKTAQDYMDNDDGLLGAQLATKDVIIFP